MFACCHRSPELGNVLKVKSDCVLLFYDNLFCLNSLFPLF